MHVPGTMVEAVEPGGRVLVQAIRPNPVVDVDGEAVCEIDGDPLIAGADAATAAVDALVHGGLLVEEAVDDHDLREHHADGSDLVGAYATKRRRLPRDQLPALRAVARRSVVHERCRLRRLRVCRQPTQGP